MPAPQSDPLDLCRGKLIAFFLAKRCGDRGADAADLAGESIKRVLERVRAGEEIDNVAAYCLGVARMVWLETRRAQRMEQIDNSVGIVERASGPSANPWFDCLEACLRDLPAPERNLLRAFYWDHRTSVEISSALTISPAAVLIRIHRIRRKLRKRIERRMERIGVIRGACRSNI